MRVQWKHVHKISAINLTEQRQMTAAVRSGRPRQSSDVTPKIQRLACCRYVHRPSDASRSAVLTTIAKSRPTQIWPRCGRALALSIAEKQQNVGLVVIVIVNLTTIDVGIEAVVKPQCRNSFNRMGAGSCHRRKWLITDRAVCPITNDPTTFGGRICRKTS